ncbi:MAG: HAD-IIA family hydrolase [Rhodospirillales bacterium]
MRATVDADWAFRRYQEIRDRLPDAVIPNASEQAADLGEIADRFDALIFDSFGVLNVGNTAIPGAAARIAALRSAGKQVIVLTNAASLPLGANVAKYAAFGFDFSDGEIVSSRAVLAKALLEYGDGMLWAVAAPQSSFIDELPCTTCPLDDQGLSNADGFILLSSADWTEDRQVGLESALRLRPRPVLVGNPDLVAPREDGFTREPGSYAHAMADDLEIEPIFFGKPYANAFEMALSRLTAKPDLSRVLMIGDTLHTDILGGAAMGIKTALVTGHGVMRGMDVAACIAESEIRPDFILPSI